MGTRMLQSSARVQRSIRSLGANWLACSFLVIVAVWCATTDRIPNRLGDAVCCFLLVLGLIFSIQCLRWEVRAISELEASGIEASYWYVLIPFGIVLLVFGIALETGVFLLYAHYAVHHCPVPSQVED